MQNNMKSSRSGFTIIELAMTMVIIVILSVAAAPRFFSTQTYEKRLFTDDLTNSIRYARKLAVATGSYIQINLTSTSLTLQRRVPGSSCNIGTTLEPVLDPVDNSSGYVRTAPSNITLQYSIGWPIYFDALGRAIQGSNCSVVGTQTVGITGGKTITIYGETGFVE